MLTVLVLSLAFKEPPETAPMPAPLVAGAPVRLAGLYTPNDCAAAALAHAKTLPPDIAKYTRYFDARTMKLRKPQYGVAKYHVNSISRYSEISALTEVNAYVWSIYLPHFRMNPETWEKLDLFESYFHIPVVETTNPIEVPPIKDDKPVVKTVNTPPATGPPVTTNATKDPPPVPKVFSKAGFGLDQKVMEELYAVTYSKSPIVRMDQFIYLTGAQQDRDGVGYLDWFEFTCREDVEKYVDLRREESRKRFQTRAAFMGKSGVALNNREIEILVSTTGYWLETHDMRKNTKKNNVINNLVTDLEHDAEEIVFVNLNGGPGYYACDNKGKQAKTVPDFIAGNNKSTNNDPRIHVGISCALCHERNGTKDVTDFSRSYFQSDPKISLKILEADEFKAALLKSAYGKSFFEPLELTAANFGKYIQAVTGADPKDFSREYEKVWSEYIDEYVTLEKAAFECGVTPEIFKKALTDYALKKGVSNPVLSSFLHEKVLPVRREHWEESFQLMMLILSGVTP